MTNETQTTTPPATLDRRSTACRPSPGAAEHFAPAFEAAMRDHLEEIGAHRRFGRAAELRQHRRRARSRRPPFDGISGLFYNLDLERDLAGAAGGRARDGAAAGGARQPRSTCTGPVRRIDALHGRRHELGLGDEQLRVLERYHTDFVRAGATARTAGAEALCRGDAAARRPDHALRPERARRRVGFHLVLEGRADLAGLPDFVAPRARRRRASAARRCRRDHALALAHRALPHLLERRDLREQAWRAWTTRGEHPGASDNRGIAAEILALRLEQARLHGYASYADYALADTMAGTQEAVTSLLMQVWRPATARAADGARALEALALSRGEPATIEPWDWRFYAEKVRQVRYALDEAEVKPYFPAGAHHRGGVRLAPAACSALSFVARADIVVYHPDVRSTRCARADGSRSACSCTTTSPGRPSAAAPG
jgi:peptidyl-dipeptidase Dcp